MKELSFFLLLSATLLHAERPYTVREIDELRASVSKRVAYGTTCLEALDPTWGFDGWIRYNNYDTQKTEDQVRTYMQAGITGKQIIDQDRADYENSEKFLQDKAAKVICKSVRQLASPYFDIDPVMVRMRKGGVVLSVPRPILFRD